MILAKDIMNKTAPVIAFDSTVLQAIEFFKSHSQSFVCVYATKDRLNGVLTESNLMRVYLKYQTHKEKDSLIYYREFFEPAQLIHQTEPFAEVVKKIMTSVGNRVFVIDESGSMIGQITVKDILPYLSGKMGEKPAPGPSGVLDSQLYLYESFFSKSPFMMHSVNQDGQIQMANEILHEVLGYEFGELIGKTIYDLYPKDVHQKAQDGIQKIFKQGYHQVIQSKMVHKNGEVIDVELASRVLIDPNKHPIGTITVSRPLEMKTLLNALPLV